VAANAPVGAGGGVMAGADAKLNPAALPVADAARLLSAVGGQAVTVDMLQVDVAAGAPANADGTLNLIHYAAWLVKEMSSGAD
jgi:hypothetical protein